MTVRRFVGATRGTGVAAPRKGWGFGGGLALLLGVLAFAWGAEGGPLLPVVGGVEIKSTSSSSSSPATAQQERLFAYKFPSV